MQSSFGSSDGSDWDSNFDEEKEKCFLVGVQVRTCPPFCVPSCATLANPICVRSAGRVLMPRVRASPPELLPLPLACITAPASAPACFLQLKQQRSKHGYGVHESLEELGRLADTAGLEVVGSTYQLLDEASPLLAWLGVITAPGIAGAALSSRALRRAAHASCWIGQPCLASCREDSMLHSHACHHSCLPCLLPGAGQPANLHRQRQGSRDHVGGGQHGRHHRCV